MPTTTSTRIVTPPARVGAVDTIGNPIGLPQVSALSDR